MDDKRVKIKTTGQKTSLLVAMLTLSIASAMFYSFYVGRKIAFHYAPLVDAAMEIKLQATTAHLWLEEIISGDRTVDIEAVWGHIDQAEWYAHAMLEGGENKKGKFISLDDADLRRQIEQTIAGIKAFREVSHERWDARSRSGVGSEIDQHSDETFLNFVIAVDNVETALKNAMTRHLRQYSIEQTLLIIIIIVLGVFIGIILYRYDRRRSTDMQRLHDKEQNLRITLNSIGDAVIVTDFNGNITHLNPVAENLTGWTLEQALSKPLMEVFNIVHAHSTKPVVNPVEQVIKTGKIAGIASQTTLISRQGVEYYIADSGAPIRSADGTITGVILVFRDVTDECALQASLESSKLFITTVLRTVPDLVWLKDLEGVYLACNEKFERLFSAKESDIIGKTDYDFVDKDLADFFREKDKLVMESNEFNINEETITYADDGHSELIETIKTPMFDANGKLIGVLGVGRDVTERKRLELRDSSRIYVLNQLARVIPLADILDTIVRIVENEIDGTLGSIYLLDHEGRHLITGAAPNLPDFYNQAIQGLDVAHGVGSCGTAAFTRKRVIVEDIQTHPFWTPFKELATEANLGSCWSEPIFGSNNRLLGTFGLYHHEASKPEDSDFKILEFAANLASIAIEQSKSNAQLRLSARVFSDTHEGITITDDNRKIIDVNPAFCEITGYSREDVIGQNPNMLNSGQQSPEFYDDMWQEINSCGYWHGEIWNRKKNGENYAELLTISVLKNEDEEVVNYVGVFTDITGSKKQQEKLNLMAHYDVLTGLPNRALFTDRFQQAIAHSKRTKSQLAVCFLDLDNFKPINDNYGHEVGDRLLIQVAERIASIIREEDTVSRQGGDEFAILLSDLESYAQCKQTLERIHHVLAQPYLIDDYSHNITASSGITMYPEDEGDIDILLRHADQAMYQAKLAGRHCYQVFNPKHDQQIVQKHHRLSEIEQAITNNEFCLYYQPKINMVSGDVFGAEALIRWIHPEQGLIPPLEFLPVIEGTKLELQIGDWVINQALMQLESWQKQGIKLEVSVNIASHHLQSDAFFSQLDDALKKHPVVEPGCLQLEILESSALGDLNAVSRIIKRCQDSLGVNVSLDDFGTGYSSLTHLRSLSANTIKIDQTFVRDMLDDPSDYAIIDGVIGLADAFDREVIAEGVETTEHGLMLLIMGCEQAQGYGIARPLPANEMAQWLSDYRPNQEWQRCGNKYRTAKENKMKLFRLVSEQWQSHFVSNIKSSPESIEYWPIMGVKHCHSGHWLKRAKQEHLFGEKCLHDLNKVHEAFHCSAHDLLLKYQAGDLDAAREGLSGLQKSFDEISNIMDHCE
jgi:diguanylate cyclase (GGDEF)-like protein/PAS domain S-box-containing protein